MSEPDEIRALVEELEAHASNYVHAAATERLLKRAAAALPALAAERDEARALESDAREHISTGTQTISQLLRYYAATVHFSRTVRNLFARGAAEIDRLEAMQTPVRCFTCEQTIERADEWFRCFDCGAHLCRLCTAPHFGDAYSRHHAQMERTEYALRGARRAAFARAKEIVVDTAMRAGSDRDFMLQGPALWLAQIAAAIEAEMGRGTDEDVG